MTNSFIDAVEHQQCRLLLSCWVTLLATAVAITTTIAVAKCIPRVLKVEP